MRKCGADREWVSGRMRRRNGKKKEQEKKQKEWGVGGGKERKETHHFKSHLEPAAFLSIHFRLIHQYFLGGQGLPPNSLESLQRESADVKILTSALKQYLRTLPEPLLTFELYPAFVTAVRQENKRQQVWVREEGWDKRNGERRTVRRMNQLLISVIVQIILLS